MSTPKQTPDRSRVFRRVGMVTYSFYETDSRVRRYAEALVAGGTSVEVYSVRRSPDHPAIETIEGVQVFRIQDRFQKTERSKAVYAWALLRFFAASFWRLTRGHLRHRYDLVHVHNMPDFLVFAAWYPRLNGGKVILDIHDIFPEFYGSKFSSTRRSVQALLKWIERRCARFAHHVIISNHLWLQKYAARTGTQDRCSVLVNHVDTRVFQPGLRTRTDDRTILIFPGGLEWHQGLDIALRAFRQVSRQLPRAEFHIYGDGIMKPALVELARDLGCQEQVRFFPTVSREQIARVMADADLGVVPKRADSFGDEAYSTKIMEFMSLGVPVVVSRTKIDQFYFDESVVRFFTSGDHDALAEAMLEVLRDSELRRRLIANALDYCARNNWEARQTDYLGLVEALLGPPFASHRAA